MTFRPDSEIRQDLDLVLCSGRTVEQAFRAYRKEFGTFPTTTRTEAWARALSTDTKRYWAWSNGTELSLNIGDIYAMWVRAMDAAAADDWMNDKIEWFSYKVRLAANFRIAYGTKAERRHFIDNEEEV